MEILAEVLVGLLQVLGELLLQMLFQALAELGLHSVKEVFDRERNPFIATIGYAILGSVAGGLSLLAFPHGLIASALGRTLNLILTPLASGAIMAAVGILRRRKDQELVGLDRFSYGALFALSMSLVRFVGASP